MKDKVNIGVGSDVIKGGGLEIFFFCKLLIRLSLLKLRLVSFLTDVICVLLCSLTNFLENNSFHTSDFPKHNQQQHPKVK